MRVGGIGKSAQPFGLGAKRADGFGPPVVSHPEVSHRLWARSEVAHEPSFSLPMSIQFSMPIPGPSGPGSYGFKLRSGATAATIPGVEHGLQVLGIDPPPSRGLAAGMLSFELALKNHIQALGSGTTRPSSHSVRRPIAAKAHRTHHVGPAGLPSSRSQNGSDGQGSEAAVFRGNICAVDLVRDWDALLARAPRA